MAEAVHVLTCHNAASWLTSFLYYEFLDLLLFSPEFLIFDF